MPLFPRSKATRPLLMAAHAGAHASVMPMADNVLRWPRKADPLPRSAKIAAATGEGATTPVSAASRVELDNLRFSYGQLPALHGVDLAVRPGEVLVLVGPSGCGKTTLLRLIAGLERPDTGSIRIDGLPVVMDGRELVPAEQRGVGLMFQDHALFPHLTVLGNVMFGLHRLPRAARRHRALQMLALVGLGDYERRYPHELSGGQQQRVALARALAPGPRVLLLDEPFANLDQQTRQSLRGEVMGILARTGTTAIMVTHDPEEALSVGHRIAVMRDGRLVQLDSVERIYRYPRDGFVAGLFGAVNVLTLPVMPDRQLRLPGGRLMPAPAAASDTVQALVRPEYLRLWPQAPDHETAARARVTDIQIAGPNCLVELALQDGPDAGLVLKSRPQGPLIPAIGAEVFLTLDPDQVHIVEPDKSRRG